MVFKISFSVEKQPKTWNQKPYSFTIITIIEFSFLEKIMIFLNWIFDLFSPSDSKATLCIFAGKEHAYIFEQTFVYQNGKNLVILVTLSKLLPGWTVNWQEDVEILQNLWWNEVHSSLNNSQDFGISFDNTPLFNVRGQNQYYNTSTKYMNMKWMNLAWKITSYIYVNYC